jgi:hypothetical protein
MRKELGELAASGIGKRGKEKGNRRGWFRVRSSEGLAMRTLFADLLYAMRQLRRSPIFAITAVLTLTMAIGANVVVFGVMNAIVLHPLPVPDSRQVYSLTSGIADTSFSYPDYKDIRRL